MRDPRFAVVFLAAASLLCSAVMADDAKVNSREYKLGLNPEKFAGDDPSPAVVKFWEDVLKPIIAKELNGNRAEGDFEKAKDRAVVFRDTATCSLAEKGYSLRERTDTDDGDRELTLKFRPADRPDAEKAKIDKPEKVKKWDPKLEEDVTPERDVAPPSMRVILSRSAGQKIGSDTELARFADAMDRYPNLAGNLATNAPAGNEELKHGPSISEVVFRGVGIDLGDKKAEFSLTIWYNDGTITQPRLAEISFSYDLKNGKVEKKVEERAEKLFRAMQVDDAMRGWIAIKVITKTEVALPNGCAAKLPVPGGD